jgi:hypothetical protein
MAHVYDTIQTTSPPVRSDARKAAASKAVADLKAEVARLRPIVAKQEARRRPPTLAAACQHDNPRVAAAAQAIARKAAAAGDFGAFQKPMPVEVGAVTITEFNPRPIPRPIADSGPVGTGGQPSPSAFVDQYVKPNPGPGIIRTPFDVSALPNTRTSSGPAGHPTGDYPMASLAAMPPGMANRLITESASALGQIIPARGVYAPVLAENLTPNGWSNQR